jgi:hypothetical protein
MFPLPILEGGMSTALFQEELEPGANGCGAFIQAVSDIDDDSAVGKISAQIQIYFKDRHEERAEIVLKFSEVSGFDLPDMDTVINGSKYLACIAATVGASIWSDVSDCKQQAMANDPDASWPEIWHATVNCVKSKSSRVKKALQGAMIACSPSFL